MLKRINIKNSTKLFIGIVLIILSGFIGLSEYFTEKKQKAFSDMNLLLYENENPEVIESENQIEENQKQEENIQDVEKEVSEQSKEMQYDYIGILEIPKISLKRGFVSLDSRYNNVNYNITVIKGSTFPDENNNNLILAAHSGICSVCFFDRLYNLKLDDVAHLYYNNIKYSYKITNIYEVEKDGTVPIYRDYNKNVLTLITCTRYSNTKQTVYILELYNKESY